MVDLKSRIYKHFEIICVCTDLVLLLLNKRFAQIQGNSVIWSDVNGKPLSLPSKHQECRNHGTAVIYVTRNLQQGKTVSMDSDFQDLQGIEAALMPRIIWTIACSLFIKKKKKKE